MNRLKTLRVRFAIWVTLLILAFLGIFGFGIHFSLSRTLYATVDDALLLSAEQLRTSLNPQSLSLDVSPDTFASFTQRGVKLLVLAQDGASLQAIGASNQDPFPAKSGFQSIPETNEVDRIRVYTLPVIMNGQTVGWVQTLQSLGGVEESLDQLRTLLILGSAILSLLAGFAGYFLAARALAPIDQITHTAHRISTEDLSARLNLPDTGDEVSRLANTFDEMLERIESGFARERQFTANASHELRTPLTAMQTILQFTRERERSISDYRQALDDLAEETNRLQGLVEALLDLARNEGRVDIQLEEIDLSLLLADVADSLRPLADQKRIALETDLPPSLVISADPDQLIRSIVNLLDNAIKYTEQGSVNLSARQEGDYALIEVADTGIGIPAEHLPHIFERFYRVEPSRSTSGVGLGLAIAEQIVRCHGGRLEVQSQTYPQEDAGGGTRFTVHLPI